MSHYAYTVLNGLLNHGKDAWFEHGGLIEPEMFGGDSRAVFQAIKDLYDNDRLVDAITVTEKLGEEYQELVLAIDTQHYCSKATFAAHVKELQIHTSENMARDIGAELLNTGDFEAARRSLDSIGDKSAKSGTVDGKEALNATLKELQSKIASDFVGLPTGLQEVDRILAGLAPANLIIVAARPSMGKTAIAVNILKHVRQGHCAVGMFSLEMSTPELTGRELSSYGIDYGRLRTPKQLTEKDWSDITAAMTKSRAGHEIYINDIGGLSIGALEAEARRMVKQHGVGLICIDYIQLVTCKAERRLEEVSEVSRRLKALAKNLNVPIIALSQLNRDVEKMTTITYSNSLLRESGQLEQDADVIMFVDRPEVWDELDRPGEADLIITKNRGGKLGTARVCWQGHFQRFTNLAPDWQAAMPAPPRIQQHDRFKRSGT